MLCGVSSGILHLLPAAYYYLVVYRKFQHNVALQIKGGWVSVVASSVNGSSATWKGGGKAPWVSVM